MYSQQTFQNPSFIKRFSHNKRFYISLKLIAPKDNDHILDYGTGDGHILHLLRQLNSKSTLYGFEPIKQVHLDEKNIKIYNNINSINSTFNKICCFEVMEHLTYENQKKELHNIKSLLNDHGRVILSIPIENGLSSLFKNIIRLILRQEHSNTSLATILKSLFSITIDRGNNDYIESHIGFYYKDLENLFEEADFTIERKLFSPFNFLNSFLNSQIFYILKVK